MIDPNHNDNDFYYGYFFGGSMQGGGRFVGPTGQRLIVAFFVWSILMLVLSIIRSYLT